MSGLPLAASFFHIQAAAEILDVSSSTALCATPCDPPVLSSASSAVASRSHRESSIAARSSSSSSSLQTITEDCAEPEPAKKRAKYRDGDDYANRMFMALGLLDRQQGKRQFLSVASQCNVPLSSLRRTFKREPETRTLEQLQASGDRADLRLLDEPEEACIVATLVQQGKVGARPFRSRF